VGTGTSVAFGYTGEIEPSSQILRGLGSVIAVLFIIIKSMVPKVAFSAREGT